MSIEVGVLAGIARPIPDVATFVTPIFSGHNGGYFVQKVSNDVIIDFQPVVLSDEFQELRIGVAVQLGDPPMYGFETTDGRFLLGEARPLAAALAKDGCPPPPANLNRSYTFSAIQRFINYALAVSADYRSFAPYVMEFSKSPVGDEFVVQPLIVDQSALKTIERFVQPIQAVKLKSITTQGSRDTETGRGISSGLSRKAVGQTTRNVLIDVVSKSAEISKADAGRALDGVIAAIKESLKKGEVVTLVGLGTFYVRKRATRMGHDPRIGATIKTKSAKMVKFLPGK